MAANVKGLSITKRLSRWLLLVTIATLPYTLVQLPQLLKDIGWHLVTVEGRVTIEDEPVAGAKVLFVPMDYSGFGADTSSMSHARTDAQGKFSLNTIGGQNGAVNGRHLVFISTSEVGSLEADSSAKMVFRHETIPAILNRKTDKMVIVPYFGTSNLRFDIQLKDVDQ